MGKRNLKLYRYVLDNYVNSKNPVTQKEIAGEFNLSLGAVKNFMYRYGLNKKRYFKNRERQVLELYKKGLKQGQIAKLLDIAQQEVSRLTKEERNA